MRKFTHKASGRNALVLKVRSSNGVRSVNVFRYGRKIVFTTHALDWIFGDARRFYDSERETVSEYANVAIGEKLLTKLLTRALAGRDARTTKVASGYVDGRHPSIEFGNSGQHVTFVAPCGDTGSLTVREAEKLLGALPSL